MLVIAFCLITTAQMTSAVETANDGKTYVYAVISLNTIGGRDTEGMSRKNQKENWVVTDVFYALPEDRVVNSDGRVYKVPVKGDGTLADWERFVTPSIWKAAQSVINSPHWPSGEKDEIIIRLRTSGTSDPSSDIHDLAVVSKRRNEFIAEGSPSRELFQDHTLFADRLVAVKVIGDVAKVAPIDNKATAKTKSSSNAITLTNSPNNQLSEAELAKKKAKDEADGQAREAAEIAKTKRKIKKAAPIKLDPCVATGHCTSTK